MESALIKTDAVPLAIRPFSKTSHMVVWLTPEFGRITTPVKGACRPKSAFLGQYDLAYTCEILYYSRERDGIHQIRECYPVALREGLRGNWRAMIAAGYLCDLAMRVSMPLQESKTIYRALTTALDALEGGGHPLVCLLWFETRLIHALGITPDFSDCPECPPEHILRRRFSIREGRFLCGHRPPRYPSSPTLNLHRDVALLFERVSLSPLPHLLEEAAAAPRLDAFGLPEPLPGEFALRRFLGIFLVFHFDVLPGPRRTALELLLN